MTISNEGKKLLSEIFSASLKSPRGVNALRFRADNERFLSEIDQIERLGYIERKNECYFLRPLALAQLAKENPNASSILNKCGLVFDLLRGMYKDNLGQKVTVGDIARKTSLYEDDARLALEIIIQTPILGSYTSDLTKEDAFITPSESILKYKSFEDILQEMLEWAERRNNQYGESKQPPDKIPEYTVGQKIALSASRTNWEAIRNEYGVTKNSFGRKINFVSNSHKREIIFRDVEHSFILASSGFSKAAVILAGGVIEELLRLYLEYKNVSPLSNNFDGYIKTCEQQGLLKDSVSRLSESVRHFRNLVHLSREETKKHTISKATAIGAVSSIFTIANDF
jgi:hypothetical protein